MDKFTVLEGVAAPLDVVNVDTDMIIPKEYLKTLKRTGLGKGLFSEKRYKDDGSENPDFVLNKPAYRNAKDSRRGQQLRLRLLARARPVGAARLRHPLRDLDLRSATFSTTTVSRTAFCRFGFTSEKTSTRAVRRRPPRRTTRDAVD